MKIACLAAGIVLAAAGLSAGPVNVELKQGAMYLPDTRAFWRNMTWENGINQYHASLAVDKAVGEKPMKAGFSLQGSGQHGFCSLTPAFKLTVNGISYQKLNFKAEDFSAWSEGDKKGVEIKMNFDGAKVILRMYMRPDSGVLWGKLYPAADTLEPITSAKASFAAMPSLLAKKNGAVQFNGGFQHEAKTPARIYSQSQEIQTLTAEDSSFIIYDKFYDGSAEDKGVGPVLFLTDSSAVQKGTMRLHDCWVAEIMVDLKPDFKEYNFGWYNQPVRISNSDFFRKFEAEKEAFTLK